MPVITYFHCPLLYSGTDKYLCSKDISKKIEKQFYRQFHFFYQILDSRYLVIDSVADESNGKELDFNVAQEGYVGSKVVIQLPKSEADE